MQAWFGAQCMTYKLHIATTHLGDQLKCQGPPGSAEWWIEHGILDGKRVIDGRAKVNPEKVFWNDQETRYQLRAMRALHPQECLSSKERADRERDRHGRNRKALVSLDVADNAREDAGDNTLLLGRGRKCGLVAAESEFVISGLAVRLNEGVGPANADADNAILAGGGGRGGEAAADGAVMDAAVIAAAGDGLWYERRGWPIVSKERLMEMFYASELHLDTFAMARLNRGDKLTSLLDATHSASENMWVLVSYEQGGEHILDVCQVQYFVRASVCAQGWQQFPEAEYRLLEGDKPLDAAPLRFAVLKCWKAGVVGEPFLHIDVSLSTGRVPDLFFVPNLSEAAGSSYDGLWMADVKEIHCQLVPTRDSSGTAFQGDARTVRAAGCRYFMTAAKTTHR
jgi:hypothetical protein